MNTVRTDTKGRAVYPKTANAGRRFADAIGPGSRTLKLDRRASGQDRRIDIALEYHGTPRRITIDRRETAQERRHAR